ncbi:MAG: helix-turn-helix transcriptional regulator [Gemmatimonadales bacterium]
MPDELINHLRRMRIDQGLTQAELAAIVGVSRKTINTVENGVFVPSTIVALRLARALGTTVERLFELPDRER